MKTVKVMTIAIILQVLCFPAFAQERSTENIFDPYKDVSRPYLGQMAPGLSPELFAPDIFPRDRIRIFNSVFSSDGKEFFFGLIP